MRVIALRALRLVPVLFLVTLATFFLADLAPGDPAVQALGPDASAERLAEARAEMGLERPVADRYVEWLGDVSTGDLGRSLVNPANRVSDLVLQSLPISLQLAVMGLVMALLVSIPLAVWSASRSGSSADRATLLLASGLISVPSFLAGLLIAYFFVFNPVVPRVIILVGGLALASSLAVRAFAAGPDGRQMRTRRLSIAALVAVACIGATLAFPDFPRTGFERITGRGGLSANLRSAFLPALTLALTETAVFTRLLRADLVGVLQEDFILSARAKGITTARVLWGHALRPATLSLVTLAGVSLGRLIGGTVVVETVFGIRGMGRLIVNEGVIAGDVRVLQGGVLVIAVGYVLVNLLVDLSYAYIDPRVRRG